MRTASLSLLVAWAAAIPIPDLPLRGDQLVSPAEMSVKDQWVRQTLLSLDKPVVWFRYDGTPSARLMPGWEKAPIETETAAKGRTQYVMRWTDPATGLEVRVVAVNYTDYPAVEWTAYLKNGGAEETPILEQIQVINAGFRRGTAQVPGLDPSGPGNAIKEAVLRTTPGDNCSSGSYEPLAFELDEKPRRFHPVGGCPTNGAWPFFNLDYGQEGVILALGWPGQWQARFTFDKDLVSACAGQETTHLRLQPGEEIRTPLAAVLFWKGENWIAGQNLWRHWFLAHNIPRPEGKPPRPLLALARPLLALNSAPDPAAPGNEIAFLENTLRLGGIKIDTLWIDTGWHRTNKSQASSGIDCLDPPGMGSWKPDPVRFPRGIREVSDYVHRQGMKLILQCEPERVDRGSYLWENHPQWLLKWGAEDKGMSDLRLLNLGNPAARQWVTDDVGRFIAEQGVDLYWQDFELDPLHAWQINDAPDRQGMTENLFVQGYLAFWDALLQRHPGLLIDSCASGGRRCDLETLRRAAPALPSDYQAPASPFSLTAMTAQDFDGNQGKTYGLSLWVPYHGAGSLSGDVYSARSRLSPAMAIGTNPQTPDWAAFRSRISDYRNAAVYYYGDYYPLTAYSKSEKVWMAWEFVRPEQGDGMVQAFRRENSPDVGIRLKLHGLKNQASYELTDLDTGKKTKATGKELLADGLALKAPAPRTALIMTFKALTASAP